jgi:hypothetical protein
MPGMEHEAAVELVRRNPRLPGLLLASAGGQVPAAGVPASVDSNLSVPHPTELRAVAVARVEHDCDAGLLVIALGAKTARASARPIPPATPASC